MKAGRNLGNAETLTTDLEPARPPGSYVVVSLRCEGGGASNSFGEQVKIDYE